MLPLINAIGSKIEQEHFVRIVAQKLGVSEAAVRTELARRPALESAEAAPEIAPAQEGMIATPLEIKIAMLMFHFGDGSPERAQLSALAGPERIAQIAQKLEPQAELLRFRFDRELSEQSEEGAVAKDMLVDIEKSLMKERMLEARIAGDFKLMDELARRAEGLRK